MVPLPATTPASASLLHRLRLCIVLGAAVLAWPTVVAAAPADPGSGCPAPPNVLVLTEIMTGDADDPRWVEVTNPGGSAVSLAKVYLQIWSDKPALLANYPLGEILPSIDAGESWAMGAVPQSSPLASLLKLKVVDVGDAFPLPICQGKVVLAGPYGVVDAFAYDLCAGLPKPKGMVIALDPAYADPCKNDAQKLWCSVPAKNSPFGSPGKSNPGCDLDGDGYYSLKGGDCDDLDPKIHIDAEESCNGQDDDCNGVTDDGIVAPTGICPSLGICGGAGSKDGTAKQGAIAQCDGKAGFVCDYPTGYEAAKETLCDGFDNDCDGLTDEGLLNACGKCGAPPGEVCNGQDDDCDGETDEGVAATEVACGGQGVCLLAKGKCVEGKAVCVQDPAFQATETTCDGQDNDCDGQTDEMMGSTGMCSVGTGECSAQGAPFCAVDGSVGCNATPKPAGQEMCGNGKDDNCDGATDEGFGVGSQCEAGVGVCRLIGKKLCAADKLSTICSVVPGPAADHEICANGLDDNCNAQTDEADCTEADDAASNLWKGCDGGAGAGPNGGWWILLGLVACAWGISRLRY